jgi:hypothetical protein
MHDGIIEAYTKCGVDVDFKKRDLEDSIGEGTDLKEVFRASPIESSRSLFLKSTSTPHFVYASIISLLVSSSALGAEARVYWSTEEPISFDESFQAINDAFHRALSEFGESSRSLFLKSTSTPHFVYASIISLLVSSSALGG